jgi:hypothetical protein
MADDLQAVTAEKLNSILSSLAILCAGVIAIWQWWRAYRAKKELEMIECRKTGPRLEFHSFDLPGGYSITSKSEKQLPIKAGAFLKITFRNVGNAVHNTKHDWPHGGYIQEYLHETAIGRLEYTFDPAMAGKPMRVRFDYETEDGQIRYQIYETLHGRAEFRRVFPPGPD